MGTIVGFWSLPQVVTTKVAITGKCKRICWFMEWDLSFRLFKEKETQAYMSINALFSSSTYYFSLGMAKLLIDLPESSYTAPKQRSQTLRMS